MQLIDYIFERIADLFTDRISNILNDDFSDDSASLKKDLSTI